MLDLTVILLVWLIFLTLILIIYITFMTKHTKQLEMLTTRMFRMEEKKAKQDDFHTYVEPYVSLLDKFPQLNRKLIDRLTDEFITIYLNNSKATDYYPDLGKLMEEYSINERDHTKGRTS